MNSEPGVPDDDMPEDEQLEEPSTDKELDEEPKKPEAANEPEPSHQAVGVGVVDGPDAAADEGGQPAAGEAATDGGAPTPAASDEVRADAAEVDQA